jgi:D-alanyl-D-alanine dipeptidase
MVAIIESSGQNSLTQFQNNRQCIIVIADSWSASTGTAQWFERDADSQWQHRGGPVSVVLGRAGLARGRGELDFSHSAGPIKHEGDNKAPAGIFRLGTAFGYAKSAKSLHTRMPYLPLTQKIVAVDDPKSHYYNQLVDKTKIRPTDWHSAENMVLADHRYKWGIVVQHNVPPVPGAGSCIFLHIWKDPTTATSGCTAMAEGDLRKLLAWLDPARGPLLVQLPRSIYNELKAKWGLPDV